MHGRAWSDNIFQSKYQDFIRTHINKIGEDKTAVGGKLYTEGMIPGVAQTCIKCHAPGAYYAGDFKVTLETLKTNATTADLIAAQENNQSNLANTTSTYGPTQSASVVAVSHTTGTLYKATYQIGHKANNEGINCAFCHSVETPRLMQSGDTYTLKSDLRVGPHGSVKAAAGSDLIYNVLATDGDMNKFFRLWGPEKPADYAATNKDANDVTLRSKDGRYTMVSKDLNGTGGKVHYTGGPFYGPFGVTGKRNENADDETNRTAQVNPHFDAAGGFNHFAENGKALCLSCHQRSAGAAVPSGEDGAGSFMELCSTWNAVTTGTDTNMNDSITSPKCQKCHMERIEGTVLHQWARPDLKFTDKALLTEHFYPDDSAGYGDDNPVSAGWLNSHAFLGASKTGGDKAAAVAKVKSGFDANVSALLNANTLTVTATLTNKTAHMFPGAHPMRRVLTRIIVTDSNGTMVDVTDATGTSTFGTITNALATLSGKTLSTTQAGTVTLEDAGNATLNFPGKVPDLNGSAVGSQKFNGSTVHRCGHSRYLPVHRRYDYKRKRLQCRDQRQQRHEKFHTDLRT